MLNRKIFVGVMMQLLNLQTRGVCVFFKSVREKVTREEYAFTRVI